MIIEACYCDDLPAHDHLYRLETKGYTVYSVQTDEIRIWVDWKAYVKSLLKEQTNG